MIDYSAVRDMIREAEVAGPLKQAVGVGGFSGASLIGALQRLGQYQASRGCYLEIGVFQGLTLVSTAMCTSSPVLGIDNFSQLDPGSRNRALVEQRIADRSLTNVSLIDADYEDAFGALSQHLQGLKVSLLFVDGPHDYRSQLYCLQAALPYLSTGALIIVDDSNYRHVRLANSDFLRFNSEFALLFEAYTPCHPDNMTAEQVASAKAGWWNGVNIMAHDPNGELSREFPPTVRSRRMFENDHTVHSVRLGYLAAEVATCLSAMSRARLIIAARQVGKLVSSARRESREFQGEFLACNTWSSDLPRSRFNALLESE